MIDTLTIARDLKDAGVEWNQAQAHAKAIASAAEKQHQDVATKDFVASQTKTLRTEISDLRGEMTALGSDLRGEMTTMESNLRGEMTTMESNLRGEMTTMESNLRGEMKALEVRILRWAIGTAFAVGGILFAALNFSLG